MISILKENKSKFFNALVKSLVIMCFLFAGTMFNINDTQAAQQCVISSKSGGGGYKTDVSTFGQLKEALSSKTLKLGANKNGKSVSFTNNDNRLYIRVTRNITITGQLLCTNKKTLKPLSAARTLIIKGGIGVNVFDITGSLALEEGSNNEKLKISGNSGKSLVKVESTGNFAMSTGVALSGNTTQDNNTAGGLYVLGTATMSGGTISGCKGTEGGAVFVAKGGSFTMSGGTITGCSASGDGGGVTALGGTFAMKGGTITDCKSKTEGGAIFIMEKGTLKMTGGTITGNTVEEEGGGIFISNATGTITGGTITENIAKKGSGGGVGAYYNSTLTIGSSSNTTRGTGPIITKNTAGSTGGGIRGNGGSGTYTKGKTYIYGGKITDNKSGTYSDAEHGRNGGGMSIHNGAFICKNAIITGNTSGTATYNKNANGGGINIESGVSTSVFTNNEIYSNVAYANGGAIHTDSPLTINQTNVFTNGAKTGNRAYGNGGQISTSSTLTLSGTSTTTPLRIYWGLAVNDGGGVYGEGSSTINVKDYVYFGMNRASVANFSSIDGAKTAKTDGGGLCGRGNVNINTSTTATTNTVQFFDNRAYNGGALAIRSGGSLNAQRMAVSSNQASHYAGGIYVADGYSSVYYSTINRNVAQYGGGVYIYNHSSNATFLSDTISNNRASVLGGGVYNARTTGNAIFNSTNVTSNATTNTSAGYGAGLYNAGECNYNDGEISNNGGTLTLTSSVIAEATGQCAYTASYNINTVVTPRGGGVFNSATHSFNILNTKISGNVATGWGGGVLNCGTVKVNGTAQFVNNKAQYGGGFFNCSYEDTAGSGSYIGTATITSATFKNNSAGNKGGAIYNHKSGSKLANLSIMNVTIDGNTATDVGSGIANYGTISRCSGTITNGKTSSVAVYNEGTISSDKSTDNQDSGVLKIYNNNGIGLQNKKSFSLNGGEFWEYGNTAVATINSGTITLKNMLVKVSSATSYVLQNEAGSTAMLLSIYGYMYSTGNKYSIYNSGNITLGTTTNGSLGNFYFSNGTGTDGSAAIYNKGTCNLASYSVIVPLNGKTMTYGVYNESGASLSSAGTIEGTGYSKTTSDTAMYTGTIQTGIHNLGTVVQAAGTIRNCGSYGINNVATVTECSADISNCVTGVFNGSSTDAGKNTTAVINKISGKITNNTDYGIYTIARINAINSSSISSNGNSRSRGSAIYATGANAIINCSSSISYNIGTDGVVAVVDAAKATISGRIGNNTTTAKGGAMYVGTNAVVNINGAIIENNKSANGGGIYISSNEATVNHLSGVIRTNLATTSLGKNVYVSGNASKRGYYNISGSAQTTNGDVFLAQNAFIQVVGQMTSTTQFTINPASETVMEGRIVVSVEYGSAKGNDALYISGTASDEKAGKKVTKRFVYKNDDYATRSSQMLQNNGKLNLFARDKKADANINVPNMKNNTTTLNTTKKNSDTAIFLSVRYNVTYHGNVASGVTVSNMQGISLGGNNYVEYKFWYEGYTMSNKTPSATKYIFQSSKSWNEKKDGTGSVHSLGSTYDGNNNLDVYAIWQVQIDSYNVKVIHYVMDTKGKYNTAIEGFPKDVKVEQGMWTTIKVLENKNLDSMSDNEKKTFVDPYFINEGYTYYSYMTVTNTNNGYPKSDGTTTIKIYYARNQYNIILFGDNGVKNIINDINDGNSPASMSSNSDYRDDSSYDGSGISAKKTYYASKTETQLKLHGYAKSGAEITDWYECDKYGNVTTSNTRLAGNVNTYTSMKYSKGDIYVKILTKKIGKINVNYYLEDKVEDKYDLLSSKKETVLPANFKVRISTLIRDYGTDGILKTDYVTWSKTGTQQYKTSDYIEPVKGNTVNVYLTRERYTISLIPGNKVDSVSAHINGFEGSTQKEETKKLGNACTIKYKAYLTSGTASMLDVSTESPMSLSATGNGNSKYQYAWFDVSHVDNVDEKTITTCETKNLYAKYTSNPYTVSLDNKNLKYLYTYVPRYVNVTYEHFLAKSGQSYYDVDPDYQVNSFNNPYEDFSINVGENVEQKYLKNNVYELESVKVLDETRTPIKRYVYNGLDEVKDLEYTPISDGTVEVQYYYKLKDIKVKFFADEGYSGLSVGVNKGEKVKTNLDNKRNTDNVIYETTVQNGNMLYFDAVKGSVKTGYVYGQGEFSFSIPGKPADEVFSQNYGDYTVIDCQFDNEKSSTAKALSIYGYLPVYLKSNMKPISYSIVYNVNLPAGETAYTGNMEDQLIKYDEVFDLNKNQYKLSSGYKFLGWAKEPTQDADKIVYKDGESGLYNLTSKAGDKINLYAVWKDPTNSIPNIHVENKYYRVGTTLTFDNLFDSVIVSDGMGNVVDTRSSGLEIIGISRIMNDGNRLPVYPEDDAYGVSNVGVSEADYGKYIPTEYERQYNVTVRAWNFKNGQKYKSSMASFKVVIWNTHRTLKYVRAISIYDLNTIPLDSKWASGELGAELIASMRKDGYEDAKYVYRFMYDDVSKIREKYKELNYNWEKIRPWYHENVMPLKHPSYFIDERKNQ